jgi:signal transduction histidine kinase
MANIVNPNAGKKVRLGLLGRAIVQSLPVGVVAYGPDLRIIETNPYAGKLIELGDYIDKSLAKGTDNPGSPGLDWSQQLKEVLSKNQPRVFDNVNYTLNGKMRLLRIVCTPLKTTESAESFGGTVIIEDVTEKVNTQRQLAGAEKLAAIGQLASRVAHELNNPMDGILRYINLSLRIIEQENLEKPKEYLTQCRQGLMRMVQIVSELLEFSHNSYAFFEYTKIERIIEDAIKTMEPRAEACGVRILRNYTPDMPKIRSSNLFQVFCNLIKNALDAMPDGGELSISTRLTADNTAVVEFRDTGTGLPTENTEAIFEPFFTTKDKIKGTGLGLAISKDIIERHDGRITAENAAEGGSVFTVYLPVTSEDS